MKSGLPAIVIALGSPNAGRSAPDVREVVLPAVPLRLQDILVAAVPPARPRLVRPAEAEREVGLARGQHLGERPLEESLPVEPVVVVAEAVYPVLAGELGLRLARLGQPKIVEAQVCGNVRLVVTREEGLRARDVAATR